MKKQKLIFIDTQTTGMRPPKGQLLEIAWCVASADCSEITVHAHTVLLPEGHSISSQVSSITGFQEPHEGKSQEEVAEALWQAITTELEPPYTVAIHYAQFEKPFLKDLLNERFDELTVICTQQLAKVLLPNLPSPNIRAVAGYFGQPLVGLNRAGPFTTATFHIWKGLCELLLEKGVEACDQIAHWIKNSEKPKSQRYAYKIDQLKRLSLPDKPGIYRMLTKSGEILYVGKATSLKDRVNSYFRGKKGRDRFKLEMLAQVWDLRVTECRSPLEAALLESDEIKRYNPRYNALLKGGRKIVFYNRDFTTRVQTCSPIFKYGPFREQSGIETMRLLFHSLQQGHFEMIFYEPIDELVMSEGWQIFAERQGWAADRKLSVRELLAQAIHLYRKLGVPPPKVKAEVDESVDEDIEIEEEDLEYTPEEVAGKFERLFRRTGAEFARSRLLTRLLNARIEYERGQETLNLFIKKGIIAIEEARSDEEAPEKIKAQTIAWDGLGLETYDRMSILLSELARYTHRIGALKRESAAD